MNNSMYFIYKHSTRNNTDCNAHNQYGPYSTMFQAMRKISELKALKGRQIKQGTAKTGAELEFTIKEI